ncbi:MAG TPA: ABC transporter substrate-binding protein [Rhizobiales bacterium]|nr:ABC transporter substrate-binding protein [Hyphomicrobiales bacterium]
MKPLMKSLAAALLAGTALTAHLASPALAETVLRVDEVAVGELDPAKATDYADSVLMFNVYDTLVLAAQGSGGVVPHLAESWETDGTTYTFELRGDVKFQSGNPLTAEDVVFSLDRMKALGQGLSYLFAGVKGAEAVDGSTVRFTLSAPYSPFLSALLRLPIVDKKLVMANLGEGDGEMKDWGQAFLSTNGAGTGAYKVVSHNPQQETVLAKNPDYFLGVPAKAPDVVRYRYGLEAATVRTLIAQGEHDISSQWLPPEVLKSLAAEGAQLLTESGGAGFYIKMNTAKPPFDDLNCRLAVANAFDYDAAIKMVAITDTVSQGSPASGPLPVGMLGSLPASEAYKRDLDAARKYLSECRYKDFTVELSWIGEVPLEERFALLMQANFAEIGIKSEVKKVPWALFTEMVTKPENTPNISQVFVNAVTGDPDTLIYGMYHSSAAGTWQSPEYLKDSKVDELLDKGRTVTSQEERAAAYTEVSKRLRELQPSIYAYDQTGVFAASKRVSVPALSDPSKGFSLNGMGFSFRLMEMNE